MLYEHKTLLGSIKLETKFKNVQGHDVLDYKESKRIDRMIAYNFLIKSRSENNILTPIEVEGIVYFVGLNLIRLAKLIGIDRSTLTNILKGKKPSKLLCHALLDAVEKELIFENYFKSKFDKDIECKIDNEYLNFIISNKAA